MCEREYPGKKEGILQEKHRCRPVKPQIAGAQLVGTFNDKWFLLKILSFKKKTKRQSIPSPLPREMMMFPKPSKIIDL